MGVEVADNQPIVRVRGFGFESGKLNAVVCVSFRLALDDRLKSGWLVGKLEQLGIGNSLSNDLSIGGTLLRCNPLPCNGFDAFDRAAFFHQKLRPCHKKSNTKVDTLA